MFDESMRRLIDLVTGDTIKPSSNFLLELEGLHEQDTDIGKWADAQAAQNRANYMANPNTFQMDKSYKTSTYPNDPEPPSSGTPSPTPTPEMFPMDSGDTPPPPSSTFTAPPSGAEGDDVTTSPPSSASPPSPGFGQPLPGGILPEHPPFRWKI